MPIRKPVTVPPFTCTPDTAAIRMPMPVDVAAPGPVSVWPAKLKLTLAALMVMAGLFEQMTSEVSVYWPPAMLRLSPHTTGVAASSEPGTMHVAKSDSANVSTTFALFRGVIVFIVFFLLCFVYSEGLFGTQTAWRKNE